MEIIASRNGNVYFETIDGEQKIFRLDFNAIADLEALLGKGIGALMSEENLGFNVIRAFYWAGLKSKEKGFTVQRAGSFVQRELAGGREMEDLMVPVTEALIASGFVDRKEVEEVDEEEEEDDVLHIEGDTEEDEAKN